jgi:hypothetical protein
MDGICNKKAKPTWDREAEMVEIFGLGPFIRKMTTSFVLIYLSLTCRGFVKDQHYIVAVMS